MTSFLAWWLGLDRPPADSEGESWRWLLAGGDVRWWGCGLTCLLAAAAVALYLRQRRRRPAWALASLVLRLGALVLLATLFLAPTLESTSRRKLPPRILVVLDGTESMLLEDAYPRDSRPAELLELSDRDTPLPDTPPADDGRILAERAALVRRWMTRSDGPLRRLQERGAVLEWAVFDGDNDSRLRPLDQSFPAGAAALPHAAAHWRPQGKVTSLPAVVQDLFRWPALGDLAAVVLISDFASNSGPNWSVLGAQTTALPVPLHAVGVGSLETADVAVRLLADAKWKREQQSTLTVTIAQRAMADRSVTLRVWAAPLSDAGGDSPAPPERRLLEQRVVRLQDPLQDIVVPYAPPEAGPWEIEAEVEALAGEADTANNRARREIKVVDDYLRLFYIAEDPNWEWRFIKEAFQRDPLVGVQGFRTFLASSDPKVRQSNSLFVDAAELPRQEFLEQDVIFLGDSPRSMVSERLGRLLQEFVGRHGGGLVILSGPRYGPAELLGTPLEEMLPVLPYRDARPLDDAPYALRLTAAAARYQFMQWESAGAEPSPSPWNRLNALPWFRPVRAPREQTVVLAEHPSATCEDGVTPQPLLAIRPYGKGEVVWCGLDEIWRLRQGVGERDYRRFWSQLIHRLGMSHALGPDKRFQLKWSADQVAVGQSAQALIESYDQNYDPAPAERFQETGLPLLLQRPDEGGEAVEATAQWVRPGVLAFDFTPSRPGRYVLSATDPFGRTSRRAVLTVAAAEAERSEVRRNLQWQQALANSSGGLSLDLEQDAPLGDVALPSRWLTTTHRSPLFRSPLWIALCFGLLLAEWSLRRALLE